MKNTIILIRYGELSLKSKYVRNAFEAQLMKNIHTALQVEHLSGTVKREWGRLYLYTDDIPKSVPVLQRIFGVVSVSPAFETTADLNELSTHMCRLASEILTKKTRFALRVTRTGTHPFTSQEVAVRIGNDIVKTTGSPVDLTTPDVELFIEIRNKKAFLFTEKISGTGGLPQGTQGTVLALIDTPQSLLAVWYLMRRGCDVHFLVVNKSLQKKLSSFMEQWYGTGELLELDTLSKKFYTNLNEIILEKKYDAVVLGTSLETIDQPIATLTEWKQHCTVPVFSPLLALTKEDIEKKGKELGIHI